MTQPKSERRTFERSWALEALASLSDGVVIVDERSKLVYRNAAAIQLAGFLDLDDDPSRWSGVHGIFEADETTPMRTEDIPIVRALRGESPRDVQVFVRNDVVPQGAHLIMSASPLGAASGRARGAVCIFHDVTQGLRAHAALKKSERERKAILDAIPDIAWLKDPRGRFVAVNQTLVQAFGKQREAEVLGRTDFDFVPNALAVGYRADDEEVMRTGLSKRIEEPFIDASGRTAWIETVKTRILGDDGEVLGTTGIARDITERKQTDQALRLSRDELEERVREAQESLVRRERLAVLGQLAGGVAHQIRNPLAAIMNATYVLRRHLQPGQHSDVEDALRIIHDEVRHANVIITGLLDYARVRSPDRHPTNIVEIIGRALSADLIPDTVLIERFIEDVPPLDADADQLHGAIFNLVRNAVEAMPNGGHLKVEARAEGGEVLIAVSDDGPGISAPVRAHLFEPLHSTKPLGIGLGLVTARTFVESHGGRITLVDQPRGARFEIRLPL